MISKSYHYSSPSWSEKSFVAKSHLLALYALTLAVTIAAIAIPTIALSGLTAAESLWGFTGIFGGLYLLGSLYILTDKKRSTKQRALIFILFSIISVAVITFAILGAIGILNTGIVLKAYTFTFWVPLAAGAMCCPYCGDANRMMNFKS